MKVRVKGYQAYMGLVYLEVLMDEHIAGGHLEVDAEHFQKTIGQQSPIEELYGQIFQVITI